MKNEFTVLEERRKINLDYSKIQNTLITEIFRGIVKNLIPLDIRFFEMKCSKLKDIYKFDCIDSFIDIVSENQYM
jgi:hypothetical protein